MNAKQQYKLFEENNHSSFSLKPIIKWPGGKEKELSYIKENAPSSFENYYEPFVGGGSVFAVFGSNKSFINDKSAELIRLYRYIASQNNEFFEWLNVIMEAWEKTLSFAEKKSYICDYYKNYREGKILEKTLADFCEDFISNNLLEIDNVLPKKIKWERAFFIVETKRCLIHKFKRMKKIELERNIMPDNDVYSNIETVFTSAMYTYLRKLYNSTEIRKIEELHTALFVYLRNYAYSGMFRYNSDGLFNVPYGGISYNHKSMISKIRYYRSSELVEYLSNTLIENLDFEDFFELYKPTEQDFVFLDPPYDSEFSTYALNEFTKEDQARLADYLCTRCKAKWQLVIKYTPYIYSLYDRENIVIKKFDKKYTVSFMNRNDKDVEHLIIMNYNKS